MKSRFHSQPLASLATLLAVLLLACAPAHAFDAEAAEKAAKDNKCTKCHAVDRKKDGPAYRDTAAKYRGDPEAEAKVTHHVTAGDMVKFPDGHQERHKKLKAEDTAEVKNLVAWILAQPGGTK